MNTRHINEQAINSLNTYFKNDSTYMTNDVERNLMDKETITNIVKQKIDTQEKKVQSLEVLRKNIAIEAEESLEKVLGKKEVIQNPVNKLTVEKMAVKLQEEKLHQIETVKKLKTARLRK